MSIPYHMDYWWLFKFPRNDQLRSCIHHDFDVQKTSGRRGKLAAPLLNFHSDVEFSKQVLKFSSTMHDRVFPTLLIKHSLISLNLWRRIHYVFRLVLTSSLIIMLLFCSLKMHQQKRQLKIGSIEQINFWLLPIYYKFLWYLIIIFIIQTIDVILVYFAFYHDIPIYHLIIHSLMFYSSSLWWLNFM